MLRFILSTCLALALCQSSLAGFIVSIQASPSPMDANATGQVLSVFLRSDSGDVSAVGFDLHGVIGNGAAVQPTMPKFQGVSYSGTVWSGLPSGYTTSGSAPEASNNYQASVGLLGNNAPPESVTISGTTPTLVAKFLIDTTGISDMTVPFSITQAGGGSDVIDSGINQILINDFSGSFQVSAVPEPATIGLIGVAVVGAAGLRRRLVNKQRAA